ncbi:MAG: hypothetical protein AAGD01_07470 [Acidobacteriota bacterium]
MSAQAHGEQWGGSAELAAALGPSLDLARQGRLYPSVILHGGSDGARRRAAMVLARALQCERSAESRPCHECRHCRRIVVAESADSKDSASAVFHPDLAVLERDLRASTSVEAVKGFLRGAQLPPFEARGQVFVIASAESLTGEAANALLKTLEEPHETSPRHFFLLAPSQYDLLSTLRSRSLGLYLGSTQGGGGEGQEALVERLAQTLSAYSRSGAGIHLLALAAILADAGEFKDPRSGLPWTSAARSLVACLDHPKTPQGARRRLLALAEALLRAPQLRLRGIPAERILEGLVARHLFSPRGEWPEVA